jgi:hypothetical protein
MVGLAVIALYSVAMFVVLELSPSARESVHNWIYYQQFGETPAGREAREAAAQQKTENLIRMYKEDRARRERSEKVAPLLEPRACDMALAAIPDLDDKRITSCHALVDGFGLSVGTGRNSRGHRESWSCSVREDENALLKLKIGIVSRFPLVPPPRGTAHAGGTNVSEQE